MDIAKKLLKELIPFVILFIVLKLLVTFVFFIVWVPTGSMEPTIDSKSVLVAVPVRNPEQQLKRGDIVVFQSDELDELMVKRLIALPGESVFIEGDGQVTINGQPLLEPYVQHPSGQQGVFEMPADCYLFFGDNRSGSLDAREWDEPYIHKDKIKGKAIFTVWPVGDFGSLK